MGWCWSDQCHQVLWAQLQHLSKWLLCLARLLCWAVMSALFSPFYLPSPDCQEGVSWLQQLPYIPTSIFLWNKANNIVRPLSYLFRGGGTKVPSMKLIAGTMPSVACCPWWTWVALWEWDITQSQLHSANGVGSLASFPQLWSSSRHKPQGLCRHVIVLAPYGEYSWNSHAERVMSDRFTRVQILCSC